VRRVDSARELLFSSRAVQVLSHRGLWREAREKNTMGAFRRSFEAGFGAETDLRDRLGELVVSHDPATRESPTADDLFALYREAGGALPLALNLKADGLQDLLRDALARHGVSNYFVFDMSVPDAVQCVRKGLRAYTRHSEHEPAPALYAESEGVWLDAFTRDWFTADDVRRHLAAGKRVCVVSPELHGRDPAAQWAALRPLVREAGGALMLCTDRPEEAVAFFA